jgi:hypothetical protein
LIALACALHTASVELEDAAAPLAIHCVGDGPCGFGGWFGLGTASPLTRADSLLVGGFCSVPIKLMENSEP